MTTVRGTWTKMKECKPAQQLRSPNGCGCSFSSFSGGFCDPWAECLRVISLLMRFMFFWRTKECIYTPPWVLRTARQFHNLLEHSFAWSFRLCLQSWIEIRWSSSSLVFFQLLQLGTSLFSRQSGAGILSFREARKAKSCNLLVYSVTWSFRLCLQSWIY